MTDFTGTSKRVLFGSIILIILGLLYVVQLKNYLLFHALTELFSIVIAFCIFIIAWNGRRYLAHNFLILIGISYLFISFLDILHTLGYTGMGVFTSYDFYANQLWIAARMMESLSLLVAFLFIQRKIPVPYGAMFFFYTITTALLVYSIFFSDIFPVCFIKGEVDLSP